MRLKIFLILALFTVTACKKAPEKPYMNTAVVTGYDTRMCACCGGLQISINTNETAATIYTVGNPDFLNITPQSAFPINLSIDWSIDPTFTCGGFQHIIISRYKTN